MIVIPCRDLGPALTFFTDELGFRLDMIMPADDPTIAVVSGHGTRLRLEEDGTDPGALRPFVDELTITRPADGAGAPGRAGMRYRDLVPDRRGGRFVGSHIAIPEGGPVPDYVHHHRIHFQVICCVAGWVSVVYEDQGPAFVLETGDCVLQPPGIRHRVLEASPGTEVVEVSSPAVHETHVDHEMTLPTADVRPDRCFGDQRFVRHRAATAPWTPWLAPCCEVQHTGIGDATGGLVGVRAIRRAAPGADGGVPLAVHGGELLLWYVVAGSLGLELSDRPDETVTAGTAVAIPAGLGYRIASAAVGLELLEVTVPDVLPLSAQAPVP